MFNLFRIFNLFRKKKEEKAEFPSHFVQIVWNEPALHNGTKDNHNKEIQRIKNGEIFKRPYTSAEVKAIIDTYHIAFDDTTMKGDEFNFEKSTALGGEFIE